MNNIKRKAAIAGLVLLAFFMLLQAQNGEPFYESSFDGAWAGSIRLATTAGTREFPLVVNLNCQGTTGIGFALLPDDLTLAPSELEIFPLIDFTRTGKKVTVKIESQTSENGGGEAAIFTHTLTLKYKAASDFLKGNFKTTDPTLKRGKIFLYRQNEERHAQKVWQGTVKKDGVNTPLFLQLVQKDAIDAGATTVSALTGFGFLGTDYGKFTLGSFDGTDITGVLSLSGEAVSVGFKKAKQKFKGNFIGATFSSAVTVQPAGTKGKSLAANIVTPTQLNVGMCNTVTIKGRNFDPGVVVHVDLAGIMVDGNENETKKQIMACLEPDMALPGDLKVSVRVTGLDGQTAEITDAFTTTAGSGPDPISFINEVQPIFTANCALSGCHAGTSPASGLNLSSNAYSRIVNVSSGQRSSLFLIKPLDPDNSYLIHKIKGNDISGSRMPFGRPPLTVDVIALIENWIRQGALNN